MNNKEVSMWMALGVVAFAFVAGFGVVMRTMRTMKRTGETDQTLNYRLFVGVGVITLLGLLFTLLIGKNVIN